MGGNRDLFCGPRRDLVHEGLQLGVEALAEVAQHLVDRRSRSRVVVWFLGSGRCLREPWRCTKLLWLRIDPLIGGTLLCRGDPLWRCTSLWRLRGGPLRLWWWQWRRIGHTDRRSHPAVKNILDVPALLLQLVGHFQNPHLQKYKLDAEIEGLGLLNVPHELPVLEQPCVVLVHTTEKFSQLVAVDVEEGDDALKLIIAVVALEQLLY
mmetsp:Transcript_63405/g.176423  ORF Transcript_63405/g.176423 Transcript_63405/m.176423 type:complete len:208 (-) Transcript_63405:1045-1668(-)